MRRAVQLGASGCVMLALGALAMWLELPLLFPPLGAAAFLILNAPASPSAQPRAVLLGHAIGAGCGWLALQVVGLGAAPQANLLDLDFAHVLSASLALAGTSLGMEFARASHPPAGATTLVVGLGALGKLWQLPVILAAAALLIVLCALGLRLCGTPYPTWASRSESAPSDRVRRPPERV